MWLLLCIQSSFSCPPSPLMCLTIVTPYPVFFPAGKPFQERLPERPPELALQLAENISLSPKIPLVTSLHSPSACQKTVQIFDGLKLGTRGTWSRYNYNSSASDSALLMTCNQGHTSSCTDPVTLIQGLYFLLFTVQPWPNSQDTFKQATALVLPHRNFFVQLGPSRKKQCRLA